MPSRSTPSLELNESRVDEMAATAALGPRPHEKTQPKIVPLWRETVRVEQMARLRALELQPGDEFGEQAWKLAHEQWRQLPEGTRIDLPSSRVFGRVLGLFRTGATLKTGKLLRLEISAQEIAELAGYSKSTVEAALRWLGCGPLEHQGAQLARGLGLIHRGRRTAFAYLGGIFRRVYRTSRCVLTNFGRLLLGLGAREEELKAERRGARARRKFEEATRKAASPHPVRRREAIHVQGQGTDAPPDAPPDDPPPDDSSAAFADVGKTWLQKIQQRL